YTGKDLGPSVPYAIQITAWFMRLHTDLLGEKAGREINGWMSVLFCLLCITGAVVWWPGVDKWRRSLWVNPKSGWKRINWDLHSAVGFWSFGLVFMWAVTGIFVVWPEPFERVINRFSPLIFYALPDAVPAQVSPLPENAVVFAQPEAPPPGAGTGGFGKGKGKGKGRRPEPRRSPGDQFVRWMYYLHFGNFAGNGTKGLWVALGLLPSLLFVTGTIMWWNRKLSPSARRARRKREPEAETSTGLEGVGGQQAS
ncbi:MAG: PepSY-associated TM helix domain-containing protein, partial [Opitutaceae bacterium]